MAAKLFRPPLAESIVCVPTRGIEEELARLTCEDRGRAFHLFLMLNDQRRHLADLFENIDLGRLELEMPFYDSDFLELVIAGPVNDFPEPSLLHGMAEAVWGSRHVGSLASVPGPRALPLPVPAGLQYQWSDVYDLATARRMRTAFPAADRPSSRGKEISGNDHQQAAPPARHKARADRCAQIRLRDQAGRIFGKYWSLCESATDG
jgi:hypothetical protein